MIFRLVGGALLAAGVAMLARRAGSLSASGAAAAVLVGTSAVAAGWTWGALLLVYFVSSSALSRLGKAAKERRTAGVVEKGGERDARQVMANGGVFALGAAAVAFAPIELHDVATVAALGALAASAADTWATEIGTLVGGTPRSLLSLATVPAGTSGGMSAAGTCAMIAGAAVMAVAAAALGISPAVGTIALAGTAGALGDSLIGATMQERRWCTTCARNTERRVHDCGTPTSLAGGRKWIDNDVVNFLATVVGAGVAALLYRT